MSQYCVACSKKTVFFCRLPGKHDPTHTLGKDKFIRYVKCLNCGSIQQEPLPTEKDLSNLVASEYSKTEDRFNFEKETSDNAEGHHLVIVDTLAKNGINKDVLEVGTGIGNLCSILQERGILCKGIDLSPELIEVAKNRGLSVEQKNIYDIEGEGIYSAIVMSHVFEHICDPEEMLKCIHKLLKNDGLFISAQPTASMTNFFNKLLRANNPNSISPFGIAYLNLNPWHIVLYSVKGMEYMSSKFGYILSDVIPMPSVKSKGFMGVIRTCYSVFNRMGEWLFPHRWPFHVAHLFVLKKI